MDLVNLDYYHVDHTRKELSNILFREEYTSNGNYHREDGPAVKYWYKNGSPMSESWFIDGVRHRINGIAFTSWFNNGLIQKKLWYNHGLLHRNDGPAFIEYHSEFFNRLVMKKWYDNGKLHREKGPAVTHYTKGHGDILIEEWYYNDQLHRTDGPAINQEWYIHGKEVNNFHFIEWCKSNDIPIINYSKLSIEHKMLIRMSW